MFCILQYTCFNVSDKYIIFGATSGSLYLFNREPCSFLQIIPNQEGAVSNVTISPNEQLIAFSSFKGEYFNREEEDEKCYLNF